MSKTLISLVILGVVLVGGYFIISGKKDDNMEAVKNETVNEDQVADTSGKKMAFSEFIKQGGSYKCEVKQAMSDFENNGTVYINGTNIRGDFSTVAEGKAMDTTFISRDGYSYTWSSLMPSTGFKMKIKTDASANADSQNYSWNAEQIGDYNCEAWTADESKFVIPTNINFKVVGV